MSISTLSEIKAYANAHFPEDYAELAPVATRILERDSNKKEFKLMVQDQIVVTMTSGKLAFNLHNVKDIEPFCWLVQSQKNHLELYQKAEALLRYCFLQELQDVEPEPSLSLPTWFKSACVDVADTLRAKKAAVDDPSKWGLTTAGQSQVQKLQDRIENNEYYAQKYGKYTDKLLDDEGTLKQKAEMFEKTIADLHTRIANLEALQPPNNNNVDWARLFATSKLENEELKSKLAISEGQTIQLARKIAELHRGMAG